MKTPSLLIFLLSFFASYVIQAGENKSYQFFDDALRIELPTELKKLSSKALNKRYGKQKVPPAYAFSDKDKSISFTFTQYTTPANTKNMRKIHKSISNMLRQSNSNAVWKKDKVYSRLETKIAVYEYEVQGIGKYQYNLTYVLPVNEQLTFISFTTTDSKYKKKWVTLARESFDSIVL